MDMSSRRWAVDIEVDCNRFIININCCRKETNASVVIVVVAALANLLQGWDNVTMTGVMIHIKRNSDGKISLPRKA
ncbi:hypothetical protein ACS0TY_034872 [Phlomoides rotata]